MIKLKFVYGILPAIVRYTEDMPKPWYGGFAKFLYVRIRNSYLEDEGILQHELTHVKQFYRLFFSFLVLAVGLFLYSLSWPSMFFYLSCLFSAILAPTAHNLLSSNFSWYRLMIEVEAYKKQLNYYADKKYRLDLFATFIATREYYRLNITKEEAIGLLRR